MDELIRQVAERTGISEDQARTAVTTVVGFIKERLPEPIASQVDGLLEGSAGAAAGGLGDLGGMIGGILGKGE